MIRAFFDAARPSCRQYSTTAVAVPGLRVLDQACCPMQVGWPSNVSTADRRAFVADLHHLKKQHLKEMVERRELPLRTGMHLVALVLSREWMRCNVACNRIVLLGAAGVDDFVRDALEAGAKLATITCTVSTAEERLHEAALSALGPSLAGQLRVFASGDARPGGLDGSSRGSSQGSSTRATAISRL